MVEMNADQNILNTSFTVSNIKNRIAILPFQNKEITVYRVHMISDSLSTKELVYFSSSNGLILFTKEIEERPILIFYKL
jgi:DNA gyrase/topoisomerase IV subunit B